MAIEYLLPLEYSFVIPKVNDIVKRPPPDCIAVYLDAFKYGLRFLYITSLLTYALSIKSLSIKWQQLKLKLYLRYSTTFAPPLPLASYATFRTRSNLSPRCILSQKCRVTSGGLDGTVLIIRRGACLLYRGSLNSKLKVQLYLCAASWGLGQTPHLKCRRAGHKLFLGFQQTRRRGQPIISCM